MRELLYGLLPQSGVTETQVKTPDSTQTCVYCVCVCARGQHTAVFLIGAVFAVLLAVTVWVQLTDALPVAAAEGEL